MPVSLKLNGWVGEEPTQVAIKTTLRAIIAAVIKTACLRLGKGAVIELDKLAGEPVDILVNGKKLAEGEVVVVEDHFGVRLTHLVEPKERIKSLGK